MKAHWWCCVLGLLCVPAGVMLSTSKGKGVSNNPTVSQDPTSISLMRINSSAEITCSSSLSGPMGLYLYRGFPDKRKIVFLSLDNGQVTKITPGAGFAGRIEVASQQQIGEGHGFTLKLSLLGLEDTNLYYCSWEYVIVKAALFETWQSPGTIIIVRERDPQEECRDHILDLILIALSAIGFSVILFLGIAALILRCKRFKRSFRPARAVKPPRPSRPQHVCPQQGVRHYPYLITSANSLDFRGIL
ncbi:uncharacterized protein LOC129091647 [Anoplopoma fimbria]|uniref:uncharacterized protein LOC129091647 n=1 Tax=Anoplopoma fimbria TaxID=229290 RepID=UPI0023EAF1BB|nr:uncharacterized protein LOC129091647 [Anoplopoma fimbria]